MHAKSRAPVSRKKTRDEIRHHLIKLQRVRCRHHLPIVDERHPFLDATLKELGKIPVAAFHTSRCVEALHLCAWKHNAG